jgi:hypothetical protein
MTPDQHDPLTAFKLLDTLMYAGVEVCRAQEPLRLGAAEYPAGTVVIPAAQPLRPYLKALLSRQFFPDNDWTRNRDGSPMRPYDMTTFCLAEFMGVELREVEEPLDIRLDRIDRLDYPAGRVNGTSTAGYLLDHRLNDSAVVVNRILAAGGEVGWIREGFTQSGREFPEGTILVHTGRQALESMASDLHLDFTALENDSVRTKFRLNAPRLGVYQRYQGGNQDEGWTRWVLEQFEFSYESIFSDRIRNGQLNEDLDVILLADDSLKAMMGPDYSRTDPGSVPVPPEYRSGLGEEGVEALEAFVREGGTLIALNRATELPIKKFHLPVENVVADLPANDFFAPGVTLRMNFDKTHPLAYGMPDEGLAVFWNSPVFSIRPNSQNQDYRIVARYGHENPLQSGWLVGPEKLYGKGALLDVKLGEGRIILFGFRPQLRAQLHGTFRLLFNAIYLGACSD